MATIQRKKHYLTFPSTKPVGFPEFMGYATLGELACCYFYKGRPFPEGRYEFELTTLTLPAGFALVHEDGSFSAPTEIPFVMPILIDVVPEGGQESFPYEQWHFCLSGAGEIGLHGCAKPILGAGEKSAGDLSLTPKQIIFFYDDSQNGMVPLKSKGPDITRDINNRYYFLPLLLPNQSICYYLLPESIEKVEGIIKKWNEGIIKYFGTPFFVGVEESFIFNDNLQIFFTDAVKPFWSSNLV